MMKAASMNGGNAEIKKMDPKTMKAYLFVIVLLLSFNALLLGKENCDELRFAERIHDAPAWWGLDLKDERSKQKLEAVINELLLLNLECFRKVIESYFENHMGDYDDEVGLASKATFHLIFFAYCDVSSEDWEDYRGPFNDTQLWDDSWNPGDPWLIDFTDSGVRIIASPTSHGGSFGNYEASFNIVKIFEQQYSKYGKRKYFPKP